MGFFSKLKKVVAGIDKGAAIAATTLPGKSGQVAGDVAQGAGIVTAIVQQIQSKPATDTSPDDAQKQATLVTAVAVDDHEQRMLEMEKTIKDLQAKLSGQSGQQGQSGTSGQS